jgi:TrmH family RNA methyltransferase
LYYQEDWSASAEHQQILAQLGVKRQKVSDEVMHSLSATETPQGVLAVITIESLSLPKNPGLLLILDALNDPGNLGTILRTAAAAGIDGVLLGPGCVDAYNPKVVRSGMGAHLRLPIHYKNWQEIARQVNDLVVYLAAAEGEIHYSDVDWTVPSALIIGNEAHGGGQRARSLAEKKIAIPMHQQAESLNAAVAAGIILFEGVRQKGIVKRF